MPSYGDLVARGDASPLMPEEFSDAILDRLSYSSAAQKLFRPIKMSRKQTRMPVLAGLAYAYFPNGNTGSDTGLIPTTTTKWDNKYLNAEEIAVIVPVPKAVLEDTEYDMWARVQDQCEQAIARTLDGAVVFGIDKPQSWGPSIYGGILQAQVSVEGEAPTTPTVVKGTATTAQGGIAEDTNSTFEFVEASGFDVNCLIASPTFKAPMRRMRDTLGQRLLDVQVGKAADGNSGYAMNGIDVTFGIDGLWPTANTPGQGSYPLALLGDKNEGIMGYRSDIEVDVLTEAVIQDTTGRINYNLAQQNMVALRLVCRFAWEVANTINWLKPDESQRFPFAALVS